MNRRNASRDTHRPFELYSASYDLLIRMLKPDVDAVEPSLVF
jgi:hypothetical protein